MRKADSLFFFSATTFALFVSACNSDPNTADAGGFIGPGPQLDATTGQTTSPVEAGIAQEAGATNPGNPGSTSDGSTVRPDAAATDAGNPSDSATDASAADAGATDGGDGSVVMGSGDSDFDMCYAQLKPNCNAKEMNTAELMQVPCKALTNIPVPLSDGGTYGPITMTAGPYGGKVDWNQGKGTSFANEVNIAEDICVPVGIDTFAEPKSVNDEIKNLRDVDWSLYTIFRPACFKKGEKYPVITWANGTCGEIAGYSALLSTIASYGYVVIAANSTWTATPPTDTVQLRALDYAKALNEDSKSPLYQKLDMEHIGAMGHSQGASATGNADDDPRIDAVIFWNTGTSNVKPFINVSGERDVSATTPASMAQGVNAATKPGAWFYYHKVLQTGGNSTGHLTLMEQPERVVDLAVSWWDWQLKGSETAKKMFVGEGCGFCNKKDEFDYGTNSLLK